MYIVSDKRMHRLSADRTGRPHIDREMSYRNSGIPKPSQVDAGSGATPTIPPRGLVAITDNADPMDTGRVPHRDAAAPPSAPRHLPGAGARQERNRQRELTIGSGRSLSVENNYGYQDPFGPHTGAITQPGFARIDINKHINGCGLVWTNHTESAPSMGTKALHDNLAWTARSGLPHLARSSHGIGAETPVRRGRFRTDAATRSRSPGDCSQREGAVRLAD